MEISLISPERHELAHAEPVSVLSADAFPTRAEGDCCQRRPGSGSSAVREPTTLYCLQSGAPRGQGPVANWRQAAMILQIATPLMIHRLWGSAGNPCGMSRGWPFPPVGRLTAPVLPDRSQVVGMSTTTPLE